MPNNKLIQAELISKAEKCRQRQPQKRIAARDPVFRFCGIFAYTFVVYLFVCLFFFFFFRALHHFSLMGFFALPKLERKKRPQDEFGVFYFRMGNSLSIKSLLTF